MTNQSTAPSDASAHEALVDWAFAASTAKRLTSTGPTVTRDEATTAVRQLREGAVKAAAFVEETSKLSAPAAFHPAQVVDRKGWIDANLASMAQMIAPVEAKLLSVRKKAPGPAAAAIGAKLTGGETGALMSFMASKVLGQYDLAPGGTPRLLLVAPNVVHVERELGVKPEDFRLWVCLHEETHRVQFTAVPWLREHMIDRARALTVDLVPDPDELPARLKLLLTQLPDAVKEGGNGLTDLVTTPAQREDIAKLAAVMALLEGHADVVMDEVGPDVVPTVADIRAKFDERRKGLGSFDIIIRRLLGLEAKMRQYKDGAVFVRGVVGEIGWDGFNAIWTSPNTLPTPAEIADHTLWLRRVHG